MTLITVYFMKKRQLHCWIFMIGVAIMSLSDGKIRKQITPLVAY